MFLLIVTKVVEIVMAARRAAALSAEADRRSDELSAVADRARDQAGAVRRLAESLTETAAAVARVAIDLCQCHGYREAFESAARFGLVQPPPGPWYTGLEGELDVNGFLRAIAIGIGDGQIGPRTAEKLDCRCSDVGSIPVTDGCPLRFVRTDEVQQASSADSGEGCGARSAAFSASNDDAMHGTTAAAGCGGISSIGSRRSAEGHCSGGTDASGRDVQRHLASATSRMQTSMHSASMPTM